MSVQISFLLFIFFNQSKSVKSRALLGDLYVPLSAGETARKSTKRRSVSLIVILPRLHSTTSQVSRAFTSAGVPFNNAVWHDKSLIVSSFSPARHHHPGGLFFLRYNWYDTVLVFGVQYNDVTCSCSFLNLVLSLLLICRGFYVFCV